MIADRLTAAELSAYLGQCPADLCDLVLDVRAFVQNAVPEAREAIKFNSLCYFRPDEAYGAIGGNVCGIGVRDDQVLLSFIHGASLPDPEGLLQGKAKAKRELHIESKQTLRDPAIKALLRASMAFRPTE